MAEQYSKIISDEHPDDREKRAENAGHAAAMKAAAEEGHGQYHGAPLACMLRNLQHDGLHLFSGSMEKFLRSIVALCIMLDDGRPDGRCGPAVAALLTMLVTIGLKAISTRIANQWSDDAWKRERESDFRLPGQAARQLSQNIRKIDDIVGPPKDDWASACYAAGTLYVLMIDCVHDEHMHVGQVYTSEAQWLGYHWREPFCTHRQVPSRPSPPTPSWPVRAHPLLLHAMEPRRYVRSVSIHSKRRLDFWNNSRGGSVFGRQRQSCCAKW